MTITLLQDWFKFKAGDVLYVLKPRVDPLTGPQLRHKKCRGQVDIGRALSMCEKELAVEGRRKPEKPKPTRRKKS